MNSTALPLLPPGPARQESLALVFLAGAIIGVLGGMIGLGGAEFRLPLLIGVFGFAALQAIIMNKAMSLVVVITALPARLIGVPLGELAPYWFIVLNILAGSLIGAWIGAHWATRLKSKTLYRVIAVLLVLIAVLLFVTHFFTVDPPQHSRRPTNRVRNRGQRHHRGRGCPDGSRRRGAGPRGHALPGSGMVGRPLGSPVPDCLRRGQGADIRNRSSAVFAALSSATTSAAFA
ncbi:sulfite exporter TauE/SafE family protein [Pseudarthrobacter sp. H2]|uniref:sulfite exporter TauE/SafE family protein n=1 Tax=Pseudarthrobacter sp. H2 TaxID=3418415 RepID=UPI003CF66D39